MMSAMVSKIGCLKNRPTTLCGVPTKLQKYSQTDSIRLSERLCIGIHGTFKGNFNFQMVKGGGGDLYLRPREQHG